ncbi:MAG TPA: GNAT family N-acetyltransferase [Polyangiaceae bacterium]|nr:GNAT family N-acetyltransferase [Polyangiaceae bacterium]
MTEREPTLRVEVLEGAALQPRLGELGALRVAVFREFPYLYDGTLEYEKKYLEIYARCPRALVVLAWDGQDCVGASTVIPLRDAPEDMQRPFVQAHIELDGIDYFGESVVAKAYRGRGLGLRFFEEREAHARRHGLDRCVFCAVDRPATHPLRPPGYVPNDAFWRKRGYVQVPELSTSLSWLDLGEPAETAKPMIFWSKRLES